jgi:hypothetical protein
MDDNTVEEILSELGGHQGCPAATLLHAFGTRQPLKKVVQAKMNRPGEFLASHSDNINGRGSHSNCIEALKTTKKIGRAYGIHLGTVKVLLGSSGGHEQSEVRKNHYLELGVKAEDIITHPDDIPLPVSHLARARTRSLWFSGPRHSPAEYISKFVKDKFTGLYAMWKPVIKFKDSQSAWLMYSMCLSRSINYVCRQISSRTFRSMHPSSMTHCGEASGRYYRPRYPTSNRQELS